MVLNFKKKNKTYLRHEQSKVPVRGDLLDLRLVRGVFHCGVCLSEEPLSNMRVLTPCGHVFCHACIAAHQETNRTRDRGQAQNGCPTCRRLIASVVRPFF